jgi:hypothetical protein
MTPYEKEYVVTTGGVNAVVALDFPGRAEITRIGVTNVAGAAFTADFFNRAFSGTALAVKYVLADTSGTGTLMYVLDTYFPVKVGDLVTVVGTSVVGYNNATQRVTNVSADGKAISTAGTAYSADAAGGTIQLVIPAVEQPNYKAYGQVGGTANAEVVSNPPTVYVNQDPTPARNIGVPRKIYAKLSIAGTYKIAIRARLGVGVG